MKKIELDSFLSYHFLSGVAYSPSGDRVSYLSHSPSLAKNGYDSTLWVCDPATGAEVRLGARTNIAGSLWLNDSEILVSLQCKGPESELRAIGLSGQERTWACLPCRSSLVGQLQDGRVVLTIEERSERLQELLCKSDEEREKAIRKMEQEDAHFHILDEYPFWSNGKGYVSKVRCRIYLLDNGKLTPVSPEGYRVEGVSISEDRSKIVYFGNSFTTVQPDTRQVSVFSADTGKTVCVHPEGDLRISRAAMDRAGNLWAAAQVMDEQQSFEPCERLFMAPQGGTLQMVGSGEWSFGNSIGSDCRFGRGHDFIVRDGKLWFIATNWDSSQVFCCEPGGLPLQVTNVDGSVDDIDVSHGKIVAVAMKETLLQELYVQTDEEFAAVTKQNGTLCDALEIVPPKEISFTNSCGNEIHGFVMEPVGHVNGRRSPAILDIHGGPHTAYGKVFYHEMQYWASKGYYVIYCNPTGSTGRGNAFGNLKGAWGDIDYKDIMEFVDVVLARFPDINPTRLGVTGGSYGGYMTNWIICHTDRFKAAATQRSIFNLVSLEGTSDCGMTFRKQHLQPTQDKSRVMEELWDRSPIKYAENIKTPTLIIHSEEDKRCWYVEGLQMFTALKQNGVEARMVLFKDENHELSRSGKPRNRIKRLKEITAWMDRFLK